MLGVFILSTIWCYFHQTIWLSIIAHSSNLNNFWLTEDILQPFRLYSTRFLSTLLIDICKLLVSVMTTRSCNNFFFYFLIDWWMMDLSSRGNVPFFFYLFHVLSSHLLSLKVFKSCLHWNKNYFISGQFCFKKFFYDELQFDLTHT